MNLKVIKKNFKIIKSALHCCKTLYNFIYPQELLSLGGFEFMAIDNLSPVHIIIQIYIKSQHLTLFI